ncbi:cyclophilin-like fold protein [Treponema socranskii]|uniref:cyclophilin-like fold protein n=1 Tax=Treponema socranskii TaxID=53419 RepID=UPI003D93C77B
MIKKLISVILAVMCIACACALDAGGDKNTQAAKAGAAGANAMKITITVNGKTLTASLYDNSSARALVELLKKRSVTIDMHDYGNFEKVGELPVSLPRNDTPTNTDAGDLILYQGKSFVIYYDKNSWNFTLLGKLEGITKAELKALLGKGNVTAVLAVQP